MKVYVVLEYWDGECKVDKLFFNLQDANNRKHRLESHAKYDETYHVIKKKVYGQIGITWRDIKIQIDKKKTKTIKEMIE